ncbi:MAG: phenylalanine--tRNA ligase subunit beta, partial [Legionellaceae bacterium]
HPQADKLTLCDVEVGQSEVLRIVCGASNVRVGLKVALALPGAHLPGDIHIKESMLRGELSQGMLCSSTELGLDDQSEGIMELPEDAPLGEPIRTYLGLDDKILEIDLTPNRGDCFSMRGVAREVAALTRLPFHDLDVPVVAATQPDVRAVELQAGDACPLMATREIHHLDAHAQTPLWMKERLRRAGIRALFPVVDVLNYVMLELGVPMHAYDTRFVQGPLQVRRGKSGEEFTLLNEQNISIGEKVLVVADDQGPLALAGIMGGSRAAVRMDTTNIILESAFFNPIAMAGVARVYGLSTDASMRFERGVDPALQVMALERATALILSLAGGNAGPVRLLQSEAFSLKHTMIDFDPKRVEALAGLHIPTRDMIALLESIGLVVHEKGLIWQVMVPSYRFDLALDVDLVEEIIRLHGYDQLKAEPIVGEFRAGRVNLDVIRTDLVLKHFMSRGYHETISYSFVDPVVQRALFPLDEVIALVNPISSELSEMRLSIWPGLIATLMHNLHRQQSTVKCFELGVVFEVHQGVVQEKKVISGLLAGESGALKWNESTRTYDFYDMKGDVESLFARMGYLSSVRFEPEVHPALHPGQSARIYRNDEPIGWLGTLHPRLADSFDVGFDVMLFECALGDTQVSDPLRYQPISKYPSIRRDLSLLLDSSVSVGRLEQVIRQVVSAERLKSFDVFDVYSGEGIPTGKKSIAIALTLQDEHRTLVDAEVNAIIDAVLKALWDELAVTLRD